ncbi:MAG: PAS domain-containing protein, partial [Anaerolineales bacterium]
QMKALYAKEPQKKELSLDERMGMVRDAAMEKIMPTRPMPMMDMPEAQGCWVKEIFDTYLIYEMGEKYFQMDYSIDDATGDVTFGDPVEVEETYTPVGKALRKFTHKAALLKDGLPASAYLVVEDPQKVTTWSLPVMDAAGKPDHRLMGGAWAALHQGYRGNKYEGPSKADAIAKLRKIYDQEKMTVPGEKGFMTFKQADGTYRWVLISSSTFRDRDGEIVTGKALAEDVERCDATGNYGPLRWWHMGGFEFPDGQDSWQTWKAGPGLDIGDCDFNMLYGKLLIESGTFKDNVIGEGVSDIQDLLEASIMFSHPRDEPGKSKEYQNIHRLERSLLPAGMASNLLTKLYVSKGEPAMNAKEKLAAWVAIFKNKPEVAKQILEDAEVMEKTADLVGLDSKEVGEMFSIKEDTPVVDPPDAEPPAPETVDEIGDMTHAQLAAFVAEAVKQSMPQPDPAAATKQAQQDQLLTDALVSLKAVTDRLATTEATLKETKQALDELTDARPVGIKQLQKQRATERTENVIQTAPTGPQMDPEFLKLARGGK